LCNKAPARPALRPGLRLSRHTYRGAPWYVMEDPSTGKSHRCTLGGYLFIGRLDGRRSVEDIWQEVVEDLGEDAPSQDDILQLLSQMHSADVLLLGHAPDVREVLERRRKTDRAILKQNVLSPMSFRIPLWNPDRFLERTAPLARPFTGPLGLLLWAGLIVSALLVLGESWGELTENVSDRLLSAGNIAIMIAVYPVVKAIHELGHGYVAKRYGAEVPEMGVMFLVLFPVPYVDATAAAAFRSKSRRAYVGAAGIMVELALAAIALHLWRVLEPGLARAVAYNVMVIGGVSTVLVNGNPLLKFDGYFVMADLLEMPNLAQRANRFWGHITQRYAFGVPGMQDFHATRGERIAFVLYAPLAFAYRIFISLTIALFLAGTYLFAGVVLALWSLTMTLGKPVGQALWELVQGPRLARVRGKAWAVTIACVVAVAGAVSLVPVPLSVRTQGVVWVPESAQVRAGGAAFVAEFRHPSGTPVTAGTPIAALTEPVFEAELAVLEAALREAELGLAVAQVEGPAAAAIAALTLADARAARDEARARAAERRAVAPVDGVFVAALQPGDAPGRYLAQGAPLGAVLPEAPGTIRAVVLQRDIDLLRRGLRQVTVAPFAAPWQAHETTILREVPAGQFTLPSPALGSIGGGPIPVDPRDEEGTGALARVFQLELAAPPQVLQAGYGGRVLVAFRLDPEPLGQRLWRGARQLVLERLDA
jgi:putative peptide zinc metalloprotease protein